MSDLEIHQFPCLSDNYGVLIHDPLSGQTAAIDAGDADALLAQLALKGWTLSDLWITHHHWDHTQGLADVKKQTGCTVTGPRDQSTPIADLDNLVGDGDVFEFAGHAVNVFQTPGHTTDMINFHLPSQKVILTGDTLFALGCGRIFEGTAPMMWDSLSKFFELPGDTQIYCGHEYTEANARFALSVDPENEALISRAKHISALRAQGNPTVPSLLSEEFETNPFLRAGDPAIRRHLGLEGAPDVDVFTEIRRRKDNF